MLKKEEEEEENVLDLEYWFNIQYFHTILIMQVCRHIHTINVIQALDFSATNHLVKPRFLTCVTLNMAINGCTMEI